MTVSGAHIARYWQCDCTFVRLTDAAVQIQQKSHDGIKEKFWIPRSIIHGADDIYLRDTPLVIGDGIELRIESWKCEKDGIEGRPWVARK